MHSNLITDMFFEESNKENIISKCEITKGNNLSEIFIFMLIEDNSSYVKLYSVDFLNQNYDNLIVAKSVKKISVFNDIRDIFRFSIYEQHTNYPNVLNVKKKLYKPLFTKIPQLKDQIK